MNPVMKLILGLLGSDVRRHGEATAAELTARVLDGTTAMDGAQKTSGELAGRLDCGLDEKAQERFDRTLVVDGLQYQEMAASVELAEAVSANLVAAPADLVAQATVTPKPNARYSPPARGLMPWLWVGGAVLATVLAAVVMLHHPSAPSDGKGPVTATPDQSREPPRMVPTGNLDSTPVPRRTQAPGGN